MNKNYNSGRQFEYRVKKYLEKKGYYVMRSAGSKSPFDLMAVPVCTYRISRNILLIQCKHGAKISKKEKEKIVALDVIFTDTAYSVVAWSKERGQIEFEIYDYGTNQWIKMEWLQ